MRFLTFVLAGLGCLPVLAGAAAPDEAAHAFFTARQAAGADLGAPGGLELASYSTWLGPELVCLLGAARRYNDAHAAVLPDSPPPFAHNDLYSGGATLPSRFSLDPASTRGTRASIKAHFEYDQPDGSVLSRTETLHMGIEKRRWVISDIEYGSPPAFDLSKPTLASGLRAALDHANREIGWDARQLEGCPVNGELARLQAQQRAGATTAAAASGSRHASRHSHGAAKAKSKTKAKSASATQKAQSATTTKKKSTAKASSAKKPASSTAKKPATSTRRAQSSSSRHTR